MSNHRTRRLLGFSLALALAATARADASVDAVRIQELGFSCLGGGTGFVELVAAGPGQSFDAGLYLGITNSVGDSTALTLNFGAATGTPWSQSRTWLLAGAQFTSNTGVTRDGALGSLDVTGGSLTLFTLGNDDEPVVIDRFGWGNAPGLPRAPHRGQSLQRVSDGFTVQVLPSPTPSSGVVPDSIACYGYQPHTAWRIDEAMFGCESATKGARFVELLCTADGRFDRNLRLNVRRADGGLISQVALFTTVAGQAALQGQRYLGATASFQSAVGLAADVTMPFALDSTGGAIELVLPNAAGDSIAMIDRIEYGARIGLASPRPGFSLQRLANGSLLEGAPTPENRAGQRAAPTACFSSLVVGRAWRIDEFGLGCRVPAAEAWFVEIRSLLDSQPADDGLGLRIRDRDGVVRLDVPAVLGTPGRQFVLGQRYLIAPPTFATASGMTPDATPTGTPDAVGGSIELYVSRPAGDDSVLHALPYGEAPGSTLPAPAPGASLAAGSTGGFEVRAIATPLNSAGASTTTECLTGQTRDGLRIAEFAVACADARSGVWFVELLCVTPETFLDDRMRLSWYSRSDSLIATLAAVPSNRVGQRLLLGSRLLLGPSSLAALGAVPDHALTALPDSLAGRVVLSRVTLTGHTQILSEISYGPSTNPLPLGGSLRRLDDSTHVLELLPSPQNSFGLIANQGGCFVVPTARPFTVRQLATRCRTGAPASFVELLVGQSLRAPADLGLAIEDAAGREIADFALFDPTEATILPQGARYLLGSTGFDMLGGVPHDQALPVELTPSGGAVVVYQRIGTPPTRNVLHRLAYGVTGAPAPPPGSSLVRSTNGAISVDTRPRPQNLAGVNTRNACWAAVDSSVRISEVGLHCFLGTSDVRFVELQNLDATAVLDTSLWLRLIDGAGMEIETKRLVSLLQLDTPWGAGGRLLAATSAFTAAAGFPSDVALGVGPATDSGEVHLLWRSLDAPAEVLMDVCRYGFVGSAPAPPPGGSLVRQPDGARVMSLVSTPRRLAGNVAAGDCFAYLPPHSMLLHEFGLQCAEGSLGAQYIELRPIGALRLDPGVGVEVFDAAGQKTADYPGLFADRAWQYKPAGTSFLLANSTDQTGAPPDLRLSAPLDTSGGRLRVYHVAPNGEWRDLGTWSYGQTGSGVVRPPPGLALQRDLHGRLFVVESRPRRYPDLAWSLPECHRSIAPKLRISEMSLGCAYEPLDGRGRFLEIENFGDAPVSLDQFQIEHGRNEILETVSLTDSSTTATLGSRSHWLMAGAGFEQANGLLPDATLRNYVPDRYWRARLLWRGHLRYSTMVLDRLAIALALDGTLYPPVPFGSSIERLRVDSTRVRVTPGPRNSSGHELPSATSCLGSSRPSSPVSIAQLSAGCFGCGPETAFLELTYGNGVGTEDVRVRIHDVEGQVRTEIADLWGLPGTPAPGAAIPGGVLHRWLVGASGFEDSVGYRPEVERPFSLDPRGGRVTVFEPGSPERIHVDLFHGPLAPGAGVIREAPNLENGWPYRFAAVPYVFPRNRAMDFPWSRYGEALATEVLVMQVGAACESGDPTTRYVTLRTSFYVFCHHSACFTQAYPPRAGRVRTLASNGAPLDSADFGPHVAQERFPPQYGWGYHGSDFPVFSSGGVLASTETDPIQVAPRMDPQGGAVQFVMLDPSGRALRTISSVEYGPVTTRPDRPVEFFGGWPPALASYVWNPETRCLPCAVHSRRLAGLTQSTAIQLDTTVTLPSGASRRVHVDGTTARSGVRLQGYDPARFAEFSTTLFTWMGETPGEHASIRARLAVSGAIRMQGSNFGTSSHFQLATVADADRGLGAVREWSSRQSRDTTVVVADTLDLEFPVRSGEPFRLTQRWTTASSHAVEELDIEAQWLFDRLPEGSRVTSCHGFGGGPVPTALANVAAEAFSDRVVLRWAGADPGERVRLERAIDAGEWRERAVLDADGEGRVGHIDTEVVSGQRIAYRLRRGDGATTGAVEVTVPLEVRLALRFVGEQPARGSIAFDITRIPGREARLELFDVAGRRVASASVGATGTATQRVILDRSPVSPGLYLARLRSGRERAESRLVVAP